MTIYSDEKGSILVMALLFALISLVFCALVIDLARAEYTTRGLQRCADAATLAAATEFVYSSNSDLDRWKNAKRAVLGVIKANPIFSGYPFPNISNSAVHHGPTDSCESSGDYRSQIYDDGNMRIELERGVYSDDGTGTFTSLESDTTCNAAADPLPIAARVTITIFNFQNTFGRVPFLNNPSFAQLSRTAVGSRID